MALVQPSASDSAQTPPSSVSYSKPRLSRSGTHSTHRSHRRSDSHRSTSTAPNPQFKRERERQLANVPRDTLLQHTISKEYELREAKHLLTTALIQLEAIREKFIHEHDTRLALEDEKKQQAVKTTKTLIDTQQDAMDAKEEVRTFQLQLENSQSELHKVRDAVHQLESDRTDLERELVRARDTARTFKEKNAVLHAREEGRREGFEEGLRQGRAIHGIIDLSQAPPPDVEELHKSSNEKPSSSRPKSSVNERLSHSIDTEIELRKIAEKDNYRLNLQVTQLSRELDQQRQKTKEVEADKKRLVDESDRLKRDLRAKEEEIARLVEKAATLAKGLQTTERKGKESVARRETQLNELKARVEQLMMDTENIRKEKAAVERKMKEELDKEKDLREKEKAAASSASKSSREARITYIPMPPPPIPSNIPTSGPIPRAPSSGSGSIQQMIRRLSLGSQSSTGSAPLEMVQSPPGSRNRPSIFSHLTGAQIIPPPESQSPRVMSQTAPDPNFLQPTESHLYGLPNGRLANGSQSTIQINIEPPSGPPSSVDHQEFEPSTAFLTPNHRPEPLPAIQETPLPVLPRIGRNAVPAPSPYEYDASGRATQSHSPVIPGVTVPMPQMTSRGGPGTPVIDSSLPLGFVPQTITGSNGISTPIWQTGTLPSGPGPSIGGAASAQAPRSGPIYGNPLYQDREDEDETYAPFGPGRPGAGSGPGMTPATPLLGPRSGVSIYAPGPAPVVPPMGGSWGYSPGPVIPGPLPHSAPSPEDNEHDDIDSETALNTRINAGIGKRVVMPPGGQDFGRGPGSASGYSNWRR